MPTPNDLWAAVDKGEQAQVETMINSDHDLVNAIDSMGDSLLMHLLGLVNSFDIPLNLIKTILKHPKLNLGYVNPETEETALILVIDSRQPEFLDLLLARDNMAVINGKELTYQTINRKLDANEKWHISCCEKNESLEVLEKALNRIDSFKAMRKIARDATITLALAKDDPSLLNRLEAAGDDLNDRMSNGASPERLLTPENKQLKAWFAARVPDRDETSTNAFLEWKKAEAQMKQIEAEALAKKTAILASSVQKRGGLLSRLRAAMK